VKIIKILLVITLITLTAAYSFAQVPSEIFLKGAVVTDIKQEEEFLWVATYGQGIYNYSFEEENWSNFSTKSGNLDNDLFYAVEVSKNFVWAGASEALFIYNRKNNRWSKRKFAQGGEFGNWIRALKYDPEENVLWIGRFRNITMLDLKTMRYTDINRVQGKDEKSNNIKTIQLDGDSLVWFGTESGAHVYNKRKNHTDPSAWGYITNKNKNFLEDGEAVSVSDLLFEGRNIWFGTDEFVTNEKPEFNVGGIYIFDRMFNWSRISTANGLAANGIYALGRTGNYIWAGVYQFDGKDKREFGKGLFLVNRLNHRVTEVDLNEIQISSSSIHSFHFDGQNMWIGTGEGLIKINFANSLARWSSKKKSSKK
jgi:ligand-binding sensor domain-containing protein